MGVFKAIANGLGTAVRKPLVLAVLYAVNVVFSAAAAAPFLTIAQAELGHSLLGSSVRPADLMWLGETALKYGERAAGPSRRSPRRRRPLPRPPGLPQRRRLRPPPRQGGQGDPGGVRRRLRTLFRAVHADLPRLPGLPLPDLRHRARARLGPDRTGDEERPDRVATAHPVERPFPHRPAPALGRPHGRRLHPHRRRRRRRTESSQGPPPRADLPQEALLPGLGPLPPHRRRHSGGHGRPFRGPRAARRPRPGARRRRLRRHADLHPVPAPRPDAFRGGPVGILQVPSLLIGEVT
ncbi:MAG: hypothetical protein M0C28_26410 [Candidatus Moduliflexus flocculans]|nr:hypothetical protein [Candidatus Moduliflexus flocculans]